MRVRVVFLQDIPNVAEAGEVKAVAGGYARNYLFPQHMAAPAIPEQLKRVQSIKKVALERRKKEAAEMGAVAERLQGVAVTIKARAGEGGKLYGSITTRAIADAVERATGTAIDRRNVARPEPIRELGTYQVAIRLHTGIAPTITVVVEAEGQEAELAVPAQAKAQGVKEEPAPQELQEPEDPIPE